MLVWWQKGYLENKIEIISIVREGVLSPYAVF
jgi:hypothetical protein